MPLAVQTAQQPSPWTESGRPLVVPSRLRVLMIVKRPSGNGGMQQQARRVTLHMRRLGVPARLISHSSERRLPRFAWLRRMPARFLHATDQYGFAWELYRHLCRYRGAYDVVHVHGLALDTFAAIAARRRTGKPLIVKPSSAGKGTKLELFGRLTRLFPFLKSLVWRGVDAWVSISDQARADLEALGVDPQRILYIPNGVDTELFRPLPRASRDALRQNLGVAQEDVVICTAARLYPNKRVDLLIRLFTEIAREFPQARLWVMGTGEMEDELRALAAELGAGERVRFWGHLPPAQVMRNLTAADVFALLSRWEGLSNAMLEAMACGVVPVVTRVGGMADVIRDGESGFLVPVEDEVEIRTALRTLVADEDRRKRMSIAAAEIVRSRFSLDETVRRLLLTYDTCHSGGMLPAWDRTGARIR